MVAEARLSLSLTDVEPVKTAILRIAEIHQPKDEEVEHWFDHEPSPSCGPACSDHDCEGHTATIKVCQECGCGHDGETPVFRAWPCPTIVALQAVVRG